jgi:hypothetical protein
MSVDPEEPYSSPGYLAWNWQRSADLTTHRELPRLSRISEDVVIIVGGGSELLSTSSNTTELYSIESAEWRDGPKLNFAHRDAEVLTLKDGSLLVIGGSAGPTKTGSVNVEMLAKGGSEFTEVAPMNTARISHAACVLADGRVLVTGGQSDPDTFLNSCEVYDPQSDRWEDGPPMSDRRAVHHVRALPDGRALVVGGGTDIEATHSVEFLEANADAWRPTASMYNPRWGFASALIDSGRTLIVAGGRVPAQKGATLPEDQMVILDSTERFDVDREQWSRTGPLNVPRSMGIPNVELAEMADGSLLFPGGRTYPYPYHGTPSTEAYDPLSGTWQMLSPMRVGASYHAWIRVKDNSVLTAGGRGTRFRPMRKAELFSKAE